MANPTTNFGWQMPQNTDLVKDLPADFEVFGQAVDTSLMDLKGGTTGQVLSKASNTDMDFTWVAQDDSNAIQNALLTTTGDTIYASAASTPARLGIGTSGQVLTVSGGVPTWATPSGSAYTLLSTTTLSGSSTTVSSINQTYKHLLVVVNNSTTATATRLQVQPNGSTTLNWTAGWEAWSSSTTNYSNGRIMGNHSDVQQSGFVFLYNYANTSYMKNGNFSINADLTGAIGAGGFFYRSTSAITSITVTNTAALSFTAGQVLIYGVN